MLAFVVEPSADEAPVRPRIRDLGIEPGVLSPGPNNAITDVAGVEVGHQTLIKGENVRTGVTAILPHGGNLFQRKVPAAVHVGNGFGKAAGFLQVQELGNIESPIILTNTLNVGTAVEASVRWTMAQPGNEGVRSVNVVVGETNDGYLNDIRGMHVTEKDVVAAIDAAGSGPVEEGTVGAGTGNSRFLLEGWDRHCITSPARRPRCGTRSAHLSSPTSEGCWRWMERPSASCSVACRMGWRPRRTTTTEGDPRGDGSCMVVIATDAPLSARNLERIARRAVLGLSRTGSVMSNGSGDFVIAFSTRNLEPADPAAREREVVVVENDSMSPLFLATVEAVEEAVYNSLLKAVTVSGFGGHTAEAIPVESLREIFETHPARGR